MTSQNKVLVVILNWNGKNYLERFLPSVIQYSALPGVEVIVADSASTDDSMEFMQNTYPDIETIILDKNYGFAGGYNKVLEQLHAEYYVLLNSDAEVTKNWLDPLIAIMDADQTIAACMPKIRSYNQREYFEYAGAAGGFIDKYGYPFCRGRIFDKIEKDSGQYDDVKEIFWATGACLFIRSSVFKNAGGFDADFFAHMEEIDLCWRIKNQGLKILYHPGSVVYHVGGGTLPKNNPWKIYLNFRNSLFLLYKNLPAKHLRLRICSRLCLDFLSVMQYCLHFNFRNAYAIIRAHLAFYRKKAIYKEKRMKIQPVSAIHPEIYNKSIVWQYFVKKITRFTQLDFVP